MRFGLEHPEYLWALALLVPIWWLGHRQGAALGRSRAAVATLLRSLVVVALVGALTGVQAAWVSDRAAVVYVLDQSDSIEAAARQRMLDFAAESVRRHRQDRREDLAGVVVFGRQAAIEVPPYAADLPARLRVERSRVRADATNLEEAIELARASMPAAARRRIVVVTDGNETVGEVRQAAHRAAAAGIGIDVVPIRTHVPADVSVEQVDVPTKIHRGQPFEARVVLNAVSSDGSPVRGRVVVKRNALGGEQLVLDEAVRLPPGKSVIPLRHQIAEPGAYTFEAEFHPHSEQHDGRSANNQATALARIAGTSRVLLIEPWNESGSYRRFADGLRQEGIEVVVQPSDATFTSLAELQAYDSVILANIPKTSGGSADSIVHISDRQVEMLLRNTQQLGAGLLMFGGPDAFGAGGWRGTPIEEAMPVDFDVKNSKLNAVGALMLVIDSSGSMNGQKIKLCKVAAREAIRSLRRDDRVGVITFDGQAREIVPLQPVAGRSHILPLIRRIGSGGGTNMFPAMSRGFAELAKSDASVKHMVVLTDGQTQPGDFAGLTSRMRAAGITVTSVAIGADADVELLNQIATRGAGKLYRVASPRAIPKIVMRESRRISRPLIFEDPGGIQPRQEIPSVITQGIGKVPPITGYVLTTAKENPLVQTLLTAPKPGSRKNPLLAVWPYGFGRTGVLATDASGRWTDRWSQWPGQRKLWSQLVQWLMRPSGGDRNYNMATQVEDGEVQVVVNALDPDGEYVEFLDITASALDPEMNPVDFELNQSGPGRYVGSFPADRAGSYLVHLVPEPGAAPLITGVNVPFGNEYRARESNWPLFEQLAEVEPANGQPGEVAAPLDETVEDTLGSNPFRDGLSSRAAFQDAWPWLVLIGCYFLLSDITVRRIDFHWGWLTRLLAPRRKSSTEPARVARLDHLARAKQRAGDQVRSRRTVQVHESPSATERPGASATDGWNSARSMPQSADVAVQGAPENESHPSSYTERLLDAKRRAEKR